MSKLLIDERPLTVLPSLVQAVGMERAVILQQIHWLLQNPSSGIERDGERWVWGTYQEWCDDYFPFWEPDTLRKHLVKLEQEGYILSAQFNGFNRTKHYRIISKKIAEVELAMRHDHATSKRKNFHPPKRHDHAGSKRDDHATSKRDDHASSYITETSTETSREDNNNSSSLSSDPLVVATWQRHYSDPMPASLKTAIDTLVLECEADAVAHAIGAAAAKGTHDFAYIAKCARNYVPSPAPAPVEANPYTGGEFAPYILGGNYADEEDRP